MPAQASYYLLPWYRRSGPVGNCVLLSLFCGPFILVPLIALATGDVYLNQTRPDGTLKKWSVLNKVAAFIILVVWVFAAIWVAASGKFSSNSESDSTPTAAVKSETIPEALQIDANELFQAYAANEVAADQRFKGKLLQVWGVVRAVQKDLLNNPFVVIGGTGALDGVQCSFPDSAEGALAQLRIGEMIKVEGIVSGKFGNVQVKKCRLEPD